MSTHSVRRYYVVRCPACGRLASYSTKGEAEERARLHQNSVDHHAIVTEHPNSLFRSRKGQLRGDGT